MAIRNVALARTLKTIGVRALPSLAETPVDQARPFLVGEGVVACSTCVALEPLLVFDTNRYYRDLGVSTRATRKDIKRAYLLLDGQSSTRLTYVASQLLDGEIRAAYDATPLGSLFLDDYVAAMLQKFGNVVDLAFSEDHDATRNQVAEPEVWGHYGWGTVVIDPDQMAAWREMLMSHLGDTTAGVRFAVGTHGFNEPWSVQKVGFVVVAFLRGGYDATPEVAKAAAARVQQLHDR